MSKQEKTTDLYIEFGEQLHKYLSNYGLNIFAFSQLTGLSSIVIEKIISGHKGIVLQTADKIAKTFGIKYYHFANPDFPFLPLNQLPQFTQEMIAKWKGEEPPEQRIIKKINLSFHIKTVLDSGKLSLKFTGSDVFALLPEFIQVQTEPRRISELLKKSKLKDLVVDTGRKGRDKDGKDRGAPEILFSLKVL